MILTFYIAYIIIRTAVSLIQILLKNSKQLKLAKISNCMEKILIWINNSMLPLILQEINIIFENEFNQLLINHNITSNFSVMHVNIRSLSKNLDQLINYLNCFKHKFSVIAISETWRNESNTSLFVIPCYNCIIKNRSMYIGKGVGIALFILDDLSIVELI